MALGKSGSRFFSFRSRKSRNRSQEANDQAVDETAAVTPTKAPLTGNLDGTDDTPRTPPLTPHWDDGRPESDGEDDADDAVPLPPPPTDADPSKSVTRDGVPVVSSAMAERFRPSDVRDDDDTGDLSPAAPASSSAAPADPRTTSFAKDTTFGGGASGRGDRSGGTRSSRDRPYGGAGTGERSTRSARSAGSKMSRGSRRSRKTVTLKAAPTARSSAFGGPPRYDWIDIETAAAVKVQSAYRRNKVMWELERQGKSTAAMRNRQRARKSTRKMTVHEDVPSLLACCGVGFLFGDATAEDPAVLYSKRKQDYENNKKQTLAEEARLRKFKFRNKGSQHFVEEFEVLDDSL